MSKTTIPNHTQQSPHHIETIPNITIQRRRVTYKERTQRVTWRPWSRHFSGLASFFLHLRKATFSSWHLNWMCFAAAVSTADVGIGSPAASTALAIDSAHTDPTFTIQNPQFPQIKSQNKNPESEMPLPFGFWVFWAGRKWKFRFLVITD